MRNSIKQLAGCVALIFAICACNAVNITSVGTVNGNAVPIGVYDFYVRNMKGMVMQQLGLSDDSTLHEQEIENENALDYIRKNAREAILELYALSKEADERGITLSEQDRQDIVQLQKNYIQSAGGRSGFQKFLDELRLTSDEFTLLLNNQKKAELLQNHIKETDPSLTFDDATVRQYVVDEHIKAKHILINIPTPEPEPVPEEEMIPQEELAPELDMVEDGAEGDVPTEQPSPSPAEETPAPTPTKSPEELEGEARATAELVLAKLNAGEDFDKLMTEYTGDISAETGLPNSPEGYIFNRETGFTESFVEAAYALAEGEYTAEAVLEKNTGYQGFHIIKRLPLTVDDPQLASAPAPTPTPSPSPGAEEELLQPETEPDSLGMYRTALENKRLREILDGIIASSQAELNEKRIESVKIIDK